MKQDAYILYKGDNLIKNAYRVLLTRGSKGCFFCEDQLYQEYLKKVVKNIKFNR